MPHANTHKNPQGNQDCQRKLAEIDGCIASVNKNVEHLSELSNISLMSFPFMIFAAFQRFHLLPIIGFILVASNSFLLWKNNLINEEIIVCNGLTNKFAAECPHLLGENDQTAEDSPSDF